MVSEGDTAQDLMLQISEAKGRLFFFLPGLSQSIMGRVSNIFIETDIIL